MHGNTRKKQFFFLVIIFFLLEIIFINLDIKYKRVSNLYLCLKWCNAGSNIDKKNLEADNLQYTIFAFIVMCCVLNFYFSIYQSQKMRELITRGVLYKSYAGLLDFIRTSKIIIISIIVYMICVCIFLYYLYVAIRSRYKFDFLTS